MTHDLGVAVDDKLGSLALFAAELRYEDIPASVVAHVKRSVLDLTGVIIGGSSEERVRGLARELSARGSSGRSSAVGVAGSIDAADAAMINAAAGCAHVLEDGHTRARGHLANNILPAIMAVAEEVDATGSELIAAFVAGYEIAARISIACRIRAEMHSSGTVHTVGAAAGVARLMRFDAAQIRETMNVAAALTVATSWNAAEDGATVRDLYAAKGAANAVWAPRWVRAGYTGAEDDVSFVFGNVSSETFDAARLTEGLGTDWLVTANYLKIHACCRTFQSAIDAAIELLAQGLDTDRVERIEVRTFEMPVLRNMRTVARNTIAAKESLPISLALTLLHGRCDHEVFSSLNVYAARTSALVERIHVEVDPALEARFPREKPARVTITLDDGRRLEHEVAVPRGDPASPLTKAELDAKFLQLTTTLSPDAATTLRATVLRLDELDSVRGLAAQLSGGGR